MLDYSAIVKELFAVTHAKYLACAKGHLIRQRELAERNIAGCISAVCPRVACKLATRNYKEDRSHGS